MKLLLFLCLGLLVACSPRLDTLAAYEAEGTVTAVIEIPAGTCLKSDGDALDILVLAETLPQGHVIQTIPIAVLKLQDNEELDSKIIAVPKEPKLQMIKCTTYAYLLENYPAVVSIIDLWFTHYKGNNNLMVIGWGDELSAIEEINKWKK